MGDQRSSANWNPDTMRHSTSELWGIVTVAAERGIDVEQCLAGTEFDLDTLCNRRARVSFTQQVEILRRLNLALPDGRLTLHAGARLHLTSFGIVGYALLASDDLGSAISLADSFGPLLNMKHRLRVERRDGMALLQLKQGYAVADDVHAACELLEIFKLINLLGDILGEPFRPEEVRLACDVDEISAEVVRVRLCCGVRTSAAVSEIWFSEGLLDVRLPQSDPATCRSCIEVCRHQLEELSRFDRTAGSVHALLEGCVDELPGMAEVASKLCMSPRSLRRRLEAEGTSFHEIIDGLRRNLAERLLSTTSMKTEIIAERLGYSDAANFRHAFKRWTGSPPRQYREQHQSGRSSRNEVESAVDPTQAPVVPLAGLIAGSTFVL